MLFACLFCLHRSLPCRVTVRNIYFEETPLELLAGVVLEGGLLSSEDIAEQLEERRQQYRVAFQLP